MTHSPRPIIYNNTTQFASTMDRGHNRVKKRDAQAMESVTSTSRKRYQTGRGAVGLATEETVQKRIDMESSAEELYLDVRDGARSPLEYRKDFALDVSKIQWVRVKRGVFRPTPVGFHDTNRPLSKDHLPASSLDKTRPSSNKLAARALRKMASRYANPSTPLARIGRLEYQFNQNPADNLQPKKADNTSIRAHDSLEHKPDLKSSSSFTQHRHHTAVATKQQPVEDARPTRRWSSDGLARHSRRGDSDVKTKDAAKDVERNNLHLELDRLSKGLGPQSVHNSQLFWPSRKIHNTLPIRDSPVAPLQQSPTLYLEQDIRQDWG